MRIYIDCEFNGFGGKLISMALVTEDGQSWYEVIGVPDNVEPWVAENVVPVLGKEPIGLDAFKASLHQWLQQFDCPTIVADWYTDLVHFFDQMGGQNHFESLNFPCRSELITNVEGYEPEIPHNALSDAFAIRKSLRRINHD